MKKTDFVAVRKEEYARARPWLIRATIVVMAVYLTWRIFFTLPLNDGIVSAVVGIALLTAEIVASFVAIVQYYESINSAEPELPTILDSLYPDVDILIATHNESTELLFKTINGCNHLDYPDKSKVHIYVCDDSDRPEMAELAREMGVGYFGLSDNKDAKSGNLNNALSKTRSPLVATFDADMIPMREFLLKTIPYFFLPTLKKVDGIWVNREPDEIDENYKIGFIQTPQSFYNADLFQYNLYSENRIPNEQDYFFREINVNRNNSNAVIYAGSNTVIARRALDDIGGIATDTITEDFETGLRIQRKGWTTYAIPQPLAHGLSPTDLRSLLRQRERWGRGCINSLKREHILTSKDIPIATKLCYFSNYIYWWTFLSRFVYILCPILYLLFKLQIVNCDFWQLLAFWLPSYLLYTIILKQSSAGVRNSHLNNVIDTIMFPYMIAPIFLEAVGIKLKVFSVTNKSRNHVGTEMIFILPHLFVLVASLAALVLCVKNTLETGIASDSIVVFWLIVNMKNIILALFFMAGRRNYRQTERFYVTLDVEIETERKIIGAKTLDISEEGLALLLDSPEYIPPDKSLKLTITYSVYKAEMQISVVHVEKITDGKWKYCVAIASLDDYNRRQYYQIVYDRHHSMPDKIADNWSIFDDFSLNVQKRLDASLTVQRKLPRIVTNIPVETESGNGVITSFNYRYISIQSPNSSALSTIDTIVFSGSPVILCLVFETRLARNNEMLFSVNNYEDLLDSEDLDEFLTSISSESITLTANATLGEHLWSHA
jgi:cellulose synthase (UDP-forming)